MNARTRRRVKTKGVGMTQDQEEPSLVGRTKDQEQGSKVARSNQEIASNGINNLERV